MKKFILPLLIAIISISGISDAQQLQRRKKPNQQGQRQQEQTPAPPTASELCPEPFGVFPDSSQCDKYYKCENGVATSKLCADGLVFIDAGPDIEKCEFAHAIDCTNRPQRQQPQPNLNCPRKNGYFAHEDPKICDKFFFCVDGAYNAITCPTGLVFSDKTGTCTWPDQAKKQHCSSSEIFEFDCPQIVGEPGAGQFIHPRYADPKDCQSFYVCVDSKIPRKNGCSRGQVFNEKNSRCDSPKNVPECKDWYKGILDYDEDGEILTTPKPRPPPGPSGTKRKLKRPPTQQQQQQEQYS